MKLNKILIISLGLVLLVGLILFISFSLKEKPKNDPLNMLENKLSFELPSNSKIENYRYNNKGGYFEVKILIEKENITDVKKQLNNFFGKPNIEISYMPNVKNICSWWDLDKNNIEAYYQRYLSDDDVPPPVPMTRNVWAFITKEINGCYYLYITY